MKKLSLTLAAVFAATSMTAFAGPMQMNEAEMDKIVAGADADYDVYLNRGGNYAIKLSGEPSHGMASLVGTTSCSDDGTGSCFFLSKDFSWNADKGRWH